MDSHGNFKCFHRMIKSAQNNVHRVSQVKILKKATATDQVNEDNLNSKMIDCFCLMFTGKYVIHVLGEQKVEFAY